MMEFIKKKWKVILIALLVIFSLNKCTVACNRSNVIDKQTIEIVQKDSIIKSKSDSLNILKIRWDDAQQSQSTYQGIAIGNQQNLLNEIESLNSALKTYKYHINNLINQNTKLIKENKKLKEQLKNK